MTEQAVPEPQPKEAETNIKETIESILVAFILAFVFRAFVVEAFVIPTGSMAPTLMGAHMRFRCDDCGYEWTVNYSGNGDGDDVVIPSRAYVMDSQGRVVVDRNGNPIPKVVHAICPNCGYRVQRGSQLDPDNSATSPPVCYGDRILVLKYLYLLKHPDRWDVVVFKAPEEPARYDYQQNFIKRLVGRPGETIMLLDGDVYVAPNVEAKDPELKDFVVQTKPRRVQDALWRIVYDNDYLPQNAAPGRRNGNEPAWNQPWTKQNGQSGWQALSGRTFSFDNPSGAAQIFFNSEANPETRVVRGPLSFALTDFLAYDVTVNQGPREDLDRPGGNDAYERLLMQSDDNVSDVRLSFYYQRESGDGPIRASVSKIDHTFIAEIASGKATLFQRVNDKQTVLASVPISADLSKPTRVDLINCDYQVTLRINDKDVIQTTPQQYHPDIQMLFDAFNERRQMPKPEITISAANQKCEISHLSLWRDIYYMNRVPNFSGGGNLLHATPADFPNMLMRLKSNPPEYFCCGDNSPISGDGRYWATPIDLPHEDLEVDSGKVPERFLMGRAFFVYWPAGFRPIDSAPALVPNFGDMRFIH
jgi:signal peptidase I